MEHSFLNYIQYLIAGIIFISTLFPNTGWTQASSSMIITVEVIQPSIKVIPITDTVSDNYIPIPHSKYDIGYIPCKWNTVEFISDESKDLNDNDVLIISYL